MTVQATPDLDPEAALAGALTKELHGQVAAMNRENFIVRMQLEAVERFQQRGSWERLTASDVEILQSEVAGLPSEIETDDIESRLFDLTALKMQLGPRRGATPVPSSSTADAWWRSPCCSKRRARFPR